MADSISTTNLWPNYSTANVQKAAAKGESSTLGKDQFLTILVAQLRNQDPMQPMQDREFIAQMAQFTSVEQLMNMSNELAMLRQNIGTASSLIGKTITWGETDSYGATTYFTGVVDTIVSDNGSLYATIGETAVDFDSIVSIANAVQNDKPGSEPGDEGEGTEATESGSGAESSEEGA